MRQLKIKQTTIDNNRAQEIENYLSAIGNIEAMPGEQVIAALAEGVKAGDIAATGKFTNAYRGIAISIARQVCHITDLPFKELVDTGIAGYVAGIRRSGENTVKILAHATWWIRESMLAAIGERYSALSYLKTKTLKTEPVTNTLRSEFFEKIYRRLNEAGYDIVPYKKASDLITQTERDNIWQQEFAGYRLLGNDVTYHYNNNEQISLYIEHDWKDLHLRLYILDKNKMLILPDKYRNSAETDRVMAIMNSKNMILCDIPDHGWFSSLTFSPFDTKEMWVFGDNTYNDKFAANMQGIVDRFMSAFEKYVAAWKETILEMKSGK